MFRPYFTHFVHSPSGEPCIGFALPTEVYDLLVSRVDSSLYRTQQEGEVWFIGSALPRPRQNLFTTIRKGQREVAELVNEFSALTYEDPGFRPLCFPDMVDSRNCQKGYGLTAVIQKETLEQIAVHFKQTEPKARFEEEADRLLIYIWGKSNYEMEGPHYQLHSRSCMFEFGFGTILNTNSIYDDHAEDVDGLDEESVHLRSIMREIRFSADNFDSPQQCFAALIFLACLSTVAQEITTEG